MTQLASVARRDKNICHICGWKVPVSEASLDHVRPRVDGGYDKNDNYRLAHGICNHARGALSIDAVRTIVADLTHALAHHPSRGQVVEALHEASKRDNRARQGVAKVRAQRPGRDLARARRSGHRSPRSA